MSTKQWLPIDVDDARCVFPTNTDDLMPAYTDIPKEFHSEGNPWVRWQQGWFFKGLQSLPEPKDGIDGKKAMRHLQCIQGSWEPKHEHKQAGVAYLASLWFKAPSAVSAQATPQ